MEIFHANIVCDLAEIFPPNNIIFKIVLNFLVIYAE